MLSTEATWRPSIYALKQIIDCIRQAGHLALRYFGETGVERKPDQTYVTQADRVLERFLVEQIRALYPDHSVLAEEANWGDIDPSRPIWVIDPLDGTTAFTQGLPGWGISIGVLFRGLPCFGLFYMPLLDDLTCTHAQDRKPGRPGLHVRSAWGGEGLLAVGTTVHQEYQLNVPRVRAIGSIGANLVYTARGVATAALIPRAYLWDLVAGAAILSQAGGELRYLSGESVDYVQLLDRRRTSEPIIAGHPQLLRDLRRKIRPLRVR
jgi:myo-inositol-1(or 4)-monophosphatase